MSRWVTSETTTTVRRPPRIGCIGRYAFRGSELLPRPCVILNSSNDVVQGGVVLQKVFLIDQPCGIEFNALCEMLGSIGNAVVVGSNWREESRVVSGNRMSAYKIRISKAQIRGHSQQVQGNRRESQTPLEEQLPLPNGFQIADTWYANV